MYHIWAAQCQIQLAGRQYSDNPRQFALLALPSRGIELFNSVRARFGGMQKRNDSVALESGLDLSKTHGNQSGFARHRQGIECGVFEQSLGEGDEIAGEPHIAPESACESIGLEGLIKCGPRRRHPHAAPGQVLFEVRNGFAIWRDDEADHVFDGPHSAGRHAKPLGAARSRSIIEFGGVRLCQHPCALVRPL